VAAPTRDLSRYRGPLPFIVEWEDVATMAQVPPATAANRGKFFLVATGTALDPALEALGAAPGSLGMVGLDAYGVSYVFRSPKLGDVVCRPDASLLRYVEVRRPDPATSENVVTLEWVPYRTPPQRALDGMSVFDIFDPDGVYDYYARLVGAVLAQMQVTNLDLATWRDPQKLPAEFLELAASSVGVRFYPWDSERLRRSKVEAAVPASRLRGTDPSFKLKFRQLGYLGYVTESWQRQSMLDWNVPVRERVPLYQQASVVFAHNQNPHTGDSITMQVTELVGPPTAYMPAPVTLTFSGRVEDEAQGVTAAGTSQLGVLLQPPVLPFSVRIAISDGGTTYYCQDNGAGALVGDFTGTIDYATGAWLANASQAFAAGNPMSASYLQSAVPSPLVPIGLSARETLENLVGRIQTLGTLAPYIEAGPYLDSVPHLLLQSRVPYNAAGNPRLTVSSTQLYLRVVQPSQPNTPWNPPSKAIGWPVIHLARLSNDAQLEVRAIRSDGDPLSPYLTIEVRPGNAYRRTRAAIVFYDLYLPQPGDRVIVVLGGTETVFEYGGNWPAVPDTGERSQDSHLAAESLLATLAAYYPTGLAISRAPLGFDFVVGVGEDGAGYVDPTAAWIEVPHGTRSGEPAIHSPTNLITVHMNAANGAPLSFPGIPQPGTSVGSSGPTPAMDELRTLVMSELVADVLPANGRVRQWVTDIKMPSLLEGAGEVVLVGDTLQVGVPANLITQTGDDILTQTGDQIYVYP